MHFPMSREVKGNQTMKFGLYHEKHFFFSKNHTQNKVEKLVPDPFQEN